MIVRKNENEIIATQAVKPGAGDNNTNPYPASGDPKEVAQPAQPPVSDRPSNETSMPRRPPVRSGQNCDDGRQRRPNRPAESTSAGLLSSH